MRIQDGELVTLSGTHSIILTYLVVIVLVIIIVVVIQVIVDIVGDVDDRVGYSDHEREERPRGESAPRRALGLRARQLLLENDRHFCRGRAPSPPPPKAEGAEFGYFQRPIKGYWSKCRVLRRSLFLRNHYSDSLE